MKKVNLFVSIVMLMAPALVVSTQQHTDSLSSKLQTMLNQVHLLQNRISDKGFDEMEQLLQDFRELISIASASVQEAKEVESMASTMGGYPKMGVFVDRNRLLVDSIEKKIQQATDQVEQFERRQGLQ